MSAFVLKLIKPVCSFLSYHPQSRLGTPKQVEYLAEYLEAERASREASKRVSLLRRCALPAPKTFAGYDWSAVTWPEGLDRDSLLSLAFLGC